ncbi:neuropeptide FF receptor 2-like [Stylophora pistillata]|uniref:neuropeptide FF receptor 2-like n=1 Tax=Stylophora pistillata TaxID=50429 RepID=UPI000C05245F|nr:neuropeptide FF receptor 2-like [Stylophora pistillata]XP_022794361.1 neuropeptide FF receptor 2-like [Stylophora pistillata]
MVNTTVCGSLEDKSLKLVKILSYSLILIISLLGNTAIIAITARNSRTLTTVNYLIANMAASDLLISIFAVPSQLSGHAWLIDGVVGSVLCKLVFFCQDISTAVSIQSLVVISIERYRAIAHPFRPAVITPKRCKLIIPLIWFAAVSLHGIYFYTARLESNNTTTTCKFSWEPTFDDRQTMELYVAVVLALVVFIPLCFIAFTYSRILWVLSKSEDSMHRAENSKVFKNVCAIMIAFACCVLPINIFAILFYFVWKRETSCNIILFGVFSKLALYSNSAISPIISLVRFNRYRQGLKDILKIVSLHFWYKDSIGNISNLGDLELKGVSSREENLRISVIDSQITSLST